MESETWLALIVGAVMVSGIGIALAFANQNRNGSISDSGKENDALRAENAQLRDRIADLEIEAKRAREDAEWWRDAARRWPRSR